MNDLIEAYGERHQRELRQLGGVMAVAVNQPKDLDKLFKGSPQDAGERMDSGEKMPVDPEQFEKWW